MFLPDQAIHSETEDRLHRVGFAHHLAKTIKDWDKDDSIVIGLYGPWGSGKTSIVNITIKHLNELTNSWDAAKKPIIVWFNPWNFSEAETLLRAFFQQILSEISKVEPNRGEEIRKGLENIGKTLGSLESVPALGQYFGAGGKVIGLFTKDKSLREQKANLDKLFKNLNRRIVVIMDDIDRLNNEEIRLLFQIIKINADFPNTIYLTAFDRKVVEAALTNAQGIQGREYLEKIVQVGFNIPQIDSSLIHSFLFQELNKILNLTDQSDFNSDRLAAIFHNGFKNLFLSIRDVKRYINSLGMTLQMVHQEVNSIDYIGLEALRVFLPEVFQGIAQYKNLLLHGENSWNYHEGQQSWAREQFDKIFAASGEDHFKIAKGISIQLFPQLNQVYSNTTYGPVSQQQWRKTKRICTEQFFDTYFLLGIPESEVSQIELAHIISIADDVREVINIFGQYVKENRFRRLINNLRDKIDQMNLDQSKGLGSALLVSLSTLPDMKGELLDFGSDIEQSFLLQDLLLKMDESDRFDWFQSQIQGGAPLFSLVRMVAYDLSREGSVRESPIFSDEQLEILKHSCLERIEQQAIDNSLLEQKNFGFIMLRWKEWTAKEESIHTFIEKIRSDMLSFLGFIQGFIGEARSQSGDSYLIHTKKSIDLKGLKIFISDEKIYESLKIAENEDTSRLSVDQKEALDLLILAMNRKDQRNPSIAEDDN